ncbi:MAG: trigger factor [bacterium]
MKIEKLERSQVKAFFTVTRSDFNEAVDASFEVNNQKVTIKGFRAGKAPKSKYLAQYGVESLYSDALDSVVNKIINAELVTSTEFKIVGAPALDLDFEKLSTEEDFEINLTFDVHPEFTLGDYKGIKVKKEEVKVTDDEVKEEINKQLNDKIELVLKKTQTIKKGDVAIFDFSGSVDGVKFDGGTSENYELKIGSGQFIPGFEDQMIGMKANTEKDVVVTFPAEYQAADLAGKEAVFAVKVHEVKEEVVPALTDELVEGFAIENVKTVSEYNTHVVDKLTTAKQNNEDNRVQNEILTTLVKNTTIDLPKTYINNRYNELMRNIEAQAKQYGIDFDLFLQLTGNDKATLQAQTKERAENDVKLDIILVEIVEKEKIEATDEQINEFITSEATKHNSTKEAFEAQYGRDIFAYNLNVQTALDLVKSSAKVTK